jgi:hypothetical protein
LHSEESQNPKNDQLLWKQGKVIVQAHLYMLGEDPLEQLFVSSPYKSLPILENGSRLSPLLKVQMLKNERREAQRQKTQRKHLLDEPEHSRARTRVPTCHRKAVVNPTVGEAQECPMHFRTRDEVQTIADYLN